MERSCFVKIGSRHIILVRWSRKYCWSVQTGGWKGAVSYKVEQVFNCPRHGGDGNSAGLFRVDKGKEFVQFGKGSDYSRQAEKKTML
jgi:hypothetical protein